MLESFPVCLIIGTFLGFLAGLGVGGGSLLILWLTSVLSMPYPEARILNLLFFLPSALIATVLHMRHHMISYKKILPAVIAGSICAAIFSYLSRILDVALLKKLFGGVLLITGLRELFYKKRPQSTEENPQ